MLAITREALAPLPLSLFLPYSRINTTNTHHNNDHTHNGTSDMVKNTIPLKRPAPSTTSSSSSVAAVSNNITRTTPGESSPSTMTTTKIRRTLVIEEGVETIKRTRVNKEVTPKARAVLDKDEFGLGQSPARRLFLDDGVRYVGLLFSPYIRKEKQLGKCTHSEHHH
jgi:hypothetical protein